jgi:hypothetical protein
MKKLIRNTSDPQSAAFWASVKKSAEGVRSAPAWQKAGINLNDRNFTTFSAKAPSVSPGAPPTAERGRD